MNKIVINHLDKTFVTSDATVMVNELEVEHPAAKLVVMAAKAQENEVGDGTNLVRLLSTCACWRWLLNSLATRMQVLTLAGELLDKAQGLLKQGLTTTEIADGYMRATAKVLITSFKTGHMLIRIWT
jgi:T-complex protein 1 subunit theta